MTIPAAQFIESAREIVISEQDRVAILKELVQVTPLAITATFAEGYLLGLKVVGVLEAEGAKLNLV